MSITAEKPAAPSIGREVWARLAWFVGMRWLAVVGGLLLVLAGWSVLRPHFDPTAALLILGTVVLYNAVLTVLCRTIYDSPRRSRRTMEILANFQIALDLLALAALAHVTGGAGSVFLLLFIFPIITAGELLIPTQAWLHAALAVALVQAIFWLDAAVPAVRVSALPPEWEQWLSDPRLMGILGGVISFQIVAAAFLSSSLAERLRRRERQLEDAVRRLAEVDELKTFFLRKASHELRAPMGAVHSLIRLFLDQYAGPLTGSQTDLLERADRRLTHMQRMVLDLLKYSRLQGAVPAEKLEPVRLDLVFLDVVGLFTPRAQERDVRIETRIQPITVLAEKAELEEVADNLISNAVKYTAPGGTVTVEAARDGRNAAVAVRDTGIGMRAEDLRRVFTEFFRAPNARAVTADGTGLGLSIVRRAVQRYGGSVRVQSRLGEGTQVQIRLPGVDQPG